jgi:hypothetical protein
MEQKMAAEFSTAMEKGTKDALDKIEKAEEAEEADDKAFHARAQRYPATIATAKQIGELNYKPWLALHLVIEAPEGTFEADVKYAPDAQEAHRYAKGSKIEVYVDPNDRQRVQCVD